MIEDQLKDIADTLRNQLSCDQDIRQLLREIVGKPDFVKKDMDSAEPHAENKPLEKAVDVELDKVRAKSYKALVDRLEKSAANGSKEDFEQVGIEIAEEVKRLDDGRRKEVQRLYLKLLGKLKSTT